MHLNIFKIELHNFAYAEYFNNVKLKPSSIEFLSLLRTLDIKIGLATSNSKSPIN